MRKDEALTFIERQLVKYVYDTPTNDLLLSVTMIFVCRDARTVVVRLMRGTGPVTSVTNYSVGNRAPRRPVSNSGDSDGPRKSRHNGLADARARDSRTLETSVARHAETTTPDSMLARIQRVRPATHRAVAATSGDSRGGRSHKQERDRRDATSQKPITLGSVHGRTRRTYLDMRQAATATGKHNLEGGSAHHTNRGGSILQ